MEDIKLPKSLPVLERALGTTAQPAFGVPTASNYFSSNFRTANTTSEVISLQEFILEFVTGSVNYKYANNAAAAGAGLAVGDLYFNTTDNTFKSVTA